MTETPGLTGHWDIDPSHSRLGSSTRHAMISRVRGAFNDVTGSAQIADDLSDSTATVVIKTASVDTRSEDRDNHLRSADFFDVETYPEIRFVSSAIDEVDEGSYIVTGELTIRGMTKTVSIPLELIGVETDPFGNLRAGLEGTRRIDRKDWGVTWNTKLDSGGVLVSDKITLEFELSLIKETAEAAPADSSETADSAAATAESPAEEAAPAEDKAEAQTPAPSEAPTAAEETPSPAAPQNEASAPAEATEPAPAAAAAPAPSEPASTEPAAAPKATTEFPPPPPVKPAEKSAEQSTDKPAEQTSGKPLGKLFGLR